MRTFNPEVFQGNLNKKTYFEGWYYKQVSNNKKHVYAFIPGISLNKNDKHAFIQIINGITGETHYVKYPLDQFKWDKKNLHVTIDKSTFTRESISLNITDENITVHGKLNFRNTSPFSSTILRPGIMGWYSFVPFMECYHGIVSANHTIEGQLNIQGENIDFNKGKGYIEKDWGTSFPESWIWLQANCFATEKASVFFSVAKIPWLGKFFIGFIAFMYLDGTYHLFTTYNKSKLIKVTNKDKQLIIQLKNKTHQLLLEVEIKKSGELIAPVNGSMNRSIKESVNSQVHVTLNDHNGNEVFNDSSSQTGLEMEKGIFNYL
jgi:hypothetical protein